MGTVAAGTGAETTTTEALDPTGTTMAGNDPGHTEACQTCTKKRKKNVALEKHFYPFSLVVLEQNG